MDKALRIEANSRAYHPICEYLEQLEWDGQERIRYVLQRYMGADASDFVYEVVKHFLMEALSRIYCPGCKAEKHILDDEKEARAYFEQLWAEAIEIYWSTENKNSLLKFSKEMEQEISEYRKQFTQEDTMAGMIQGWLDAYKGTHVCYVQIWKGAFDHFDREPKKFETNEICSIMDTQITGWKRAGVHRFSKEGYGRQRSWVREGAEEGGNEPDKDGFTKLTKAEQLELPFDLPDKEKG